MCLLIFSRLACVQEQRLPMADGRLSPTLSQGSSCIVITSEDYPSENGACPQNHNKVSIAFFSNAYELTKINSTYGKNICFWKFLLNHLCQCRNSLKFESWVGITDRHCSFFKTATEFVILSKTLLFHFLKTVTGHSAVPYLPITRICHWYQVWMHFHLYCGSNSDVFSTAVVRWLHLAYYL